MKRIDRVLVVMLIFGVWGLLAVFAFDGSARASRELSERDVHRAVTTVFREQIGASFQNTVRTALGACTIRGRIHPAEVDAEDDSDLVVAEINC